MLSNKGTFAFINLISSLNEHVTDLALVDVKTTPAERFSCIEPYLNSFFESLKKLTKEEKEELRSKHGSGADSLWLHKFQSLVNERFPEFEPLELIDWKERQDKELQDRGRTIGIAIERYLKKQVIHILKILFGRSWELSVFKLLVQI